MTAGRPGGRRIRTSSWLTRASGSGKPPGTLTFFRQKGLRMLLQGKKLLITGVLTPQSIAYGVAEHALGDEPELVASTTDVVFGE